MQLPSQILPTLLSQALEKAGSYANLARALNMGLSNVRNWYRGGIPAMPTIDKLAVYVHGETSSNGK